MLGEAITPDEKERYYILPHISGQLREAAMRIDIPSDVRLLMDIAAERLDDAHEEWLEKRVALIKEKLDNMEIE